MESILIGVMRLTLKKYGDYRGVAVKTRSQMAFLDDNNIKFKVEPCDASYVFKWICPECSKKFPAFTGYCEHQWLIHEKKSNYLDFHSTNYVYEKMLGDAGAMVREGRGGYWICEEDGCCAKPMRMNELIPHLTEEHGFNVEYYSDGDYKSLSKPVERGERRRISLLRKREVPLREEGVRYKYFKKGTGTSKTHTEWHCHEDYCSRIFQSFKDFINHLNDEHTYFFGFKDIGGGRVIPFVGDKPNIDARDEYVIRVRQRTFEFMGLNVEMRWKYTNDGMEDRWFCHHGGCVGRKKFTYYELVKHLQERHNVEIYTSGEDRRVNKERKQLDDEISYEEMRQQKKIKEQIELSLRLWMDVAHNKLITKEDSKYYDEVVHFDNLCPLCSVFLHEQDEVHNACVGCPLDIFTDRIAESVGCRPIKEEVDEDGDWREAECYGHPFHVWHYHANYYERLGSNDKEEMIKAAWKICELMFTALEKMDPRYL